jgi:hypothetical protein
MQQTSDTTALQISAAPPCPPWCAVHDRDAAPTWDVSRYGDIQRVCLSHEVAVPIADGDPIAMRVERFASFSPDGRVPLVVEPATLRAFGQNLTLDESLTLAREILGLVATADHVPNPRQGDTTRTPTGVMLDLLIEGYRQQGYDSGYTDGIEAAEQQRA